MDFQWLHEHAFVRLVMEDMFGIKKEKGFNFLHGPSDELELDELQFYVQRVGFTLTHAISWIEQLHHAVYYLTDFGYGKKAKEMSITRPAHLLYHIENYLIRLASVYDRCLQLTNTVFHICMSDEHVNNSAIISNLQVTRTHVPKLLRNVKKALKDYEQYRHEVVHRHSHLDSDLRKIELMYIPTKDSWPPDKTLTYERLVSFRAHRAREFTIKKKAEFVKINTSLAAALQPLFDEFFIQYKTQKSRLEKLI